tara:strand:+ start:130 stop:858 length:729 start_codon:yes stop_codon:yes gene_type:complete
MDRIFFVTGQSNSQGVGGTVNPFDDRDQIDNRIYSWNMRENKWEIANLFAEIGSKPVCNQCFAFHFAKAYVQQYPTHRVGLIVCGFPSTSISAWTVPSNQVILPPSIHLNKVDTGLFFWNSLQTIYTALQHHQNNHIDGILWHQGENDCYESYEYYYFRIMYIINCYRHYFGMIPFIVGELLDSWVTNKQNVVLRYLPVYPLVRCARSGKCQNTGDGVHLSTEGHRWMGKEYFNQYQSLIET